MADGSIIIDTKIDTSGVNAGAKEIEKAFKNIAKIVDGIGKASEKALAAEINAVKSLSDTFLEQEKRMEALAQSIAQGGSDSAPAKAETPAVDYSAVQKQLDETQAKINEVNTTSRAVYDIINEVIDDYNKKTEEAKAKQKALEDEAKAAYDEIAAEAVVANQEIAELSKELQMLLDRQKELRKAGIGAGYEEFDQITIRVAEINAKLKEYDEQIKEASKKTSFFRKLLSQVGNTLKAVRANSGRAAISIGKVVGRGVVKSVKGLFNGFKKLKKATDGMSTSFRDLVRYGIGIRTLFALAGRIRSFAAEGLGNLAQYSDSTNGSLSRLKSALIQLQNSLATAFAPILTVVEPILTRLINLLSQAATYIGMFIAKITGQTSFTKAVAVQADYAEGLESTAGAAKDAEKALNGYLSPLDEINKMDAPDTSSAGSGGAAGGGLTPDQMFETVEIEPISFDSWGAAFDSFLDYLLGTGLPALESGLSKIAKKINTFSSNVYEMFTFPGVIDKVVLLGVGIAAAFNGFVDQIDWAMIGNALGSGLNLAVTFLVSMLTTFNWSGLGASIATSINNAISQIDFTNVGILLSGKFKILFETAMGFFTTLDMTKVGEGASQIITSFLESITQMIEDTDWELVGQQIVDLLATVDWAAIAKDLWDAGAALLDGILDVFKELPDNVQAAMIIVSAFFLLLKSQTATSALVSGIGKVVSSLGTLGTIGVAAAIAALVLLIAKWDKVEAVMQRFDNWLSGIFTMDFTKNFGVLGGIATGFLRGIEGVYLGAKEFLTGIITFVKGVFTGNWKQAWNGVKSVFSGIWKTFVGIVKSPINLVIGAINGLISGAISGMNAVIGALNKISIKIPNWVPVYGGDTFGVNIGKIPQYQIPYLASGAVIPPRSEFLAVLGDQKRGRNLEAPESLIRQIVREESGGRGGNYTFVAQINRRVLFEEMIREAEIRMMQSGNNPFELA